MIRSHLSPNLDGLAVLERDGGQLDVAMHIARLVMANPAALLDAHHRPFVSDLQYFDHDGVKVNGDPVAGLQQIERGQGVRLKPRASPQIGCGESGRDCLLLDSWSRL